MIKRVKIHSEEAKKKKKGLYGKYPHKDSNNVTQFRVGYFHHLKAFCGLGFVPTNADRLVDTSDNGIFEWDDATIKAINNWNVHGTKKEKQLMLVAYLFELVYDLMLSPTYCVSLNPGFESCHGYFGED